ncbi:MAG: PTS sugar transporter subunit IIA [Deltaproteobacteria bacterium]|nr:PTS sugar transporter subunit IIA [Deltaproteobacteria bacterium]
MKLADILSQDCIMPDIKATGKREALEEMVEELAFRFADLNKEKLLEAILERERLGSTGIGYGVAIPHARLKGINSIAVLFGRSIKGVEFQAMDERPAHLFFLIAAPEDSNTAHLKVLARISRLLKDAGVRKRLMEASAQEEIYRIIIEEDGKL